MNTIRAATLTGYERCLANPDVVKTIDVYAPVQNKRISIKKDQIHSSRSLLTANTETLFSDGYSHSTASDRALLTELPPSDYSRDIHTTQPLTARITTGQPRCSAIAGPVHYQRRAERLQT